MHSYITCLKLFEIISLTSFSSHICISSHVQYVLLQVMSRDPRFLSYLPASVGIAQMGGSGIAALFFGGEGEDLGILFWSW